MDPDEALRCVRAAIEEIRELEAGGAEFGEQVSDLVEHFEALDAWLTRGGFKPKDWK